MDSETKRLAGELLGDDETAAIAAARRICELGPAAVSAVDALVKALHNENRLLVRTAAMALGRIGPRAAAAISVLISRLRTPEAAIRGERLELARALGRIGLESIQPLLILLDDPDSNLRAYALRGLARVDPALIPDEAVGALVAALGDPVEDVRSSACQALKDLNMVDGPVRQAMYGTSTMRRVLAARTILSVNPGDEPAIAVAADSLSDANTGVRFEAACTLANYAGRHARIVEQDLVSALQDKDDRVRHFATSALGALDEEIRLRLVPTILPLLNDPCSDVRESAIIAIGMFGSQSPGVVDALTRALSDPRRMVRNYAVRELDALGPAARSSAPALRRLLADPAMQELYEDQERKNIRDAIRSVIRPGRGGAGEANERQEWP